MSDTATLDIQPGRLFIGGEWRESAEGGRINVVDPSTGAVVTSVARAGTIGPNITAIQQYRIHRSIAIAPECPSRMKSPDHIKAAGATLHLCQKAP